VLTGHTLARATLAHALTSLQADVRVHVSAEDSVDDVVLSTVTQLHAFIDSNPPKWQQWKDSAKASGINWVN
jgi:hypothetical protein